MSVISQHVRIPMGRRNWQNFGNLKSAASFKNLHNVRKIVQFATDVKNLHLY